MNSRWILKSLVFLLFLSSASLFASTHQTQAATADVSIIGDDPSTTESSVKAVDDSGEAFVHLDGGVTFRDIKNDSALFCLDTNGSSYGSGCTNLQSWNRGEVTFTWAAGLGFRYNNYFALDLSYWGLQKQSTQLMSSASHLSLRTWLITGLYQAQIRVFSNVYLVPEAGVVYVTSTVRGENNGVSVYARTINWRPAVGLGVLTEIGRHFALNLTGLYIPQAGHAPTLGIRYPSMQMLVLGVRYAF